MSGRLSGAVVRGAVEGSGVAWIAANISMIGVLGVWFQ